MYLLLHDTDLLNAQFVGTWYILTWTYIRRMSVRFYGLLLFFPSHTAASIASFSVEYRLAFISSLIGSLSPSWNALRAVREFSTRMGSVIFLSTVLSGQQAALRSISNCSTLLPKSISDSLFFWRALIKSL